MGVMIGSAYYQSYQVIILVSITHEPDGALKSVEKGDTTPQLFQLSTNFYQIDNDQTRTQW